MAATRLGWPVLELSDPVSGSIATAGRTAAALAAMNLGVATGLAYGVARGDLQTGRNAAIQLATKLPLAMAGVTLEVRNSEYLQSARPAIFVANHQSTLDIPVLGALLERDFTVVAKKEARWDPRAVIGSLVVAVLHWWWAQGTKWMVGWGWLQRPVRRSARAPSISPHRLACPSSRSCCATPVS